jgi:dUTPase
VDAGAIETAGAAAFAGLSKLLEPFASEGLAAERIIDVTKRQGRTQSGAEIYEPAEPIGDRLGKSIQHVLGSFLPGIIEQFTTVKGGEFVQGRTARAFTGLYGKQGESYSPAEEAGTLLTGVRGLKLSVPKSLGFAGGEYSSLRSSAVQIFTKIADDNDVTEEDVVNAYIKSNQARRRVQAELKVKVDAAMNAGMDRASVFRAFQNTGVSAKELSAIIDNRYIPPKISRALIREVNNEVNIKKENRILQRLPMRELIDVRLSLMNSPIIGESSIELNEPVSQGLFDDLLTSTEVSQVPPISNNVEPETFLGNATETISNVTDSIAETSNKAFDRVKTFVPSLLGDRANQEIADRARDNQ